MEGLEERWTPALFRWLGDTTANSWAPWGDGRNWDAGPGTNRYPEAAQPTAQDTVQFGADGNSKDFYLELFGPPGTAGTIQIQQGWTRNLVIERDLTIEGGGSYMRHAGNYIQVAEFGDLWFKGGTIAWESGDINATLNTGSVYLSDGAPAEWTRGLEERTSTSATGPTIPGRGPRCN